jgi:redox-sensitive bicupin YhaK (pirin superfamily)
MNPIKIKQIIDPIETSDGAGVKLKRSIGTSQIDYFDPFLMLDEFGSENSEDYIKGFPPHPHRGIETVTYMLNGEFEHKDSAGGQGKMSPGDVQWMKTGRGIIHSEMPAMENGKLHGFQLWINMPSDLKKNKPEYLYIDSEKIPCYQDNEKSIKIIAGEYLNIEGSVTNHNVNPTYFDVELEEGKIVDFEIPEENNSFIYLVEGKIKIGDEENNDLENSKLILLEKGNKLVVTSETKSKFLLISGKPIKEPIARGGPFVMNTRQEVQQAIEDFNNGNFAKY